ncbi:putative U-box domain-containing protein 50 [Spatholobus suberectus]|nr:putative U-box domain-containing protein 50 [Spatholobus suberectus]
MVTIVSPPKQITTIGTHGHWCVNIAANAHRLVLASSTTMSPPYVPYRAAWFNKMDATQTEKIYVAVGYDILDGFQTLSWALKKWNSHPCSIVILHVKYNTSKKYVTTLLGKLPAKGACEKNLERSMKYEQRIIEKLLSKYIALCDNVPAETFEVEKFDEPMQKRTIDLIYGLGITKLIMGFSFMKPSLKSEVDINGLFYVHQHKPAFCELFIICEGKQVTPRVKNNEIIMEDDNGVKIASMRDKINFKDWLERMFFDKTIDSQPRSSCGSSTSSTNLESYLNQNQWEFSFQEIENYLQELLPLNLEEGSSGQDNQVSHISPIEPYVEERNTSDNTSAAENIEILKDKLNEAYRTIQMKRKEDEANWERHEKAEWAIYICNRREEELESLIKKEVTRKEELKKELDAEKEQLHENRMDIEESKKRLSLVAEQQSELLNSLHISTLAVSQAETKLGEALTEKTEMLREMNDLRRQRDGLNRRIQFYQRKRCHRNECRLIEKGCGLREYTKEEIILATHNFSEQMRLKSGGNWTNVYRGQINYSTVAIKKLISLPELSQLDFQAKVGYLGSIRQPHLVSVLGFCSEPKCLVLEYMHKGSLEEMLFCRNRSRALSWRDCLRIAVEVCSGLGFLNAAQPRPIIHCVPSPSKILLDCNLVAKITGFGLPGCSEECNDNSDMKAIGVLLQNLLTGRRNWVTMDTEAFFDEIGGQWPLDVGRAVVGLAMRCMSMNCEPNGEMSITRVREELSEIRRKGNDMVSREGWRTINGGDVGQDSTHVPSVFVCPILQKIMKNPHIAADGFSYELEAIEEWLQSGHDISPKNLTLKHKLLTPNHTLRSLIQDWQRKTAAKVAN